MDLKVLAIDPVTQRASFLIQPKTISGMDLLVQLVVLTLLTSPGSDILEPGMGAGIRDLIGMNIDPTDVTEIQAEVLRKISKAQSEIIDNQIGLNVPQEEKLRRLALQSIRAIPEEGRIDVRIRVENELGRTKDVVI